MATCPSCASEVLEGNRFCGSCGAAIETPTSAPTETSFEKGNRSADLFPEARFIHLLRDPAAVVRSLGNFDRVGGEPRQADDACRQWLRHVKACLDAERSLPPETVMRLAHADLDSSPEPSLRRCLEFLGEPWSADCLKPLGHRINSSAPRDPEATIHVDANLLAEARSICAEAGLDPPDSMVGREDSEASREHVA